MEFSSRCHKQLANAGFLNRSNEFYQRHRWRLESEHCGRPKRTDHLIVAHVNEPHVPFIASAFASDRQNDVRVNGREGNIDNFKVCGRKSLAQKDLQIATCAISRFRIAHCNGFTENKNANGCLRLLRFHSQYAGITRNFFREEPQAEVIILNEIIFIADLELLEKSWGVAIAADAQCNFERSEQQQRQ